MTRLGVSIGVVDGWLWLLVLVCAITLAIVAAVGLRLSTHDHEPRQLISFGIFVFLLGMLAAIMGLIGLVLMFAQWLGAS